MFRKLWKKGKIYRHKFSYLSFIYIEAPAHILCVFMILLVTIQISFQKTYYHLYAKQNNEPEPSTKEPSNRPIRTQFWTKRLDKSCKYLYKDFKFFLFILIQLPTLYISFIYIFETLGISYGRDWLNRLWMLGWSKPHSLTNCKKCLKSQ